MKHRFRWIFPAAAIAVIVLLAGGFALFLRGGSFNSTPEGELVVPHASPIWLSYARTYAGGASYVFIGDVTVSGTYYYGYDYDGGGPLVAFLVPDKASATILPHWKRWGFPQRIDLTNPDAFALAALDPGVVAKIKRKAQVTARGHITIVVSDYEVAGECDAPVYQAKFQSVFRPETRLATKDNTVFNCG